MREMVSLYAIVLLGVLNILLWRQAFGFCQGCRLRREPRCGCDPEGRRRPWRNHGPK